MTDKKAQSTIARWSIAAAVFGGVCNLLCLAVEIYRDYCFGRVHSVWDWLGFPTAISLAPLLALFVLRHRLPVVLIYASVLFLILILIWQVDYPAQCNFGAAPFRKFDEPGLLLLFFGMISAAVVLVWATIRFVVFVRHALKSDRPAS